MLAWLLLLLVVLAVLYVLLRSALAPLILVAVTVLSALAALGVGGWASVHLFGSLLNGCAPRQWDHYPQVDAIDSKGRFQWYYHSHSPADRPGGHRNDAFVVDVPATR